MEHIGGGDASGELPVNADVARVESILNSDLGGDDVRALVDAVFDRGVRVCVDETWSHDPSRGIDDRGPRRRHHILAHSGDLAAFDQDRALFDRARGADRHDFRVRDRGDGVLSLRAWTHGHQSDSHPDHPDVRPNAVPHRFTSTCSRTASIDVTPRSSPGRGGPPPGGPEGFSSGS